MLVGSGLLLLNVIVFVGMYRQKRKIRLKLVSVPHHGPFRTSSAVLMTSQHTDDDVITTTGCGGDDSDRISAASCSPLSSAAGSCYSTNGGGAQPNMSATCLMVQPNFAAEFSTTTQPKNNYDKMNQPNMAVAGLMTQPITGEGLLLTKSDYVYSTAQSIIGDTVFHVQPNMAAVCGTTGNRNVRFCKISPASGARSSGDGVGVGGGLYAIQSGGCGGTLCRTLGDEGRRTLRGATMTTATENNHYGLPGTSCSNPSTTV